ncbi:hypothetical protein IX51_02705 [uncultured archaeon]|nr:hypothetical protein IX51_02705 [uncultured archaeon]
MISQYTDSDLETLMERYSADSENDIVKPSFGKGSISDLPEVFMHALGLGGGQNVPEVLRGTYEQVDHLVFFLLDGFGHSTMRGAIERFHPGEVEKFLSESAYTPITSVFPSTTSTATVTVQTCREPVQHGIIGYTAYMSEIGAICNMISLTPLGNRGKSILDDGWSDEGLLGGETLYSAIGKESLDSYLYLPSAIKNSGLTRITGRGANITGYYSVPQMFSALRKNIESSGSGGIHFCYISTIDTISHRIGPGSEEVAVDMDNIFHLIEKELTGKLRINGSLGVMISADHGHTTVPIESVKDAASDERLASYMRTPVVGDMRAPFLRIKPGLLQDAFEYVQYRYGGEFLVRYGHDMLKKGYFGNSDRNYDSRDRFGGIVLLPRGRTGMIDSRLNILDPGMDISSLVGVHGGLSRDEMIVPFISRVKNYH